MNFKKITQVWLWIAGASCVVCLMISGLTLYIEQKSQCATSSPDSGQLDNKIYFSTFASAFLVFFWVKAGTKRGLSATYRAIDLESQNILFVRNDFLITGAHLAVYRLYFDLM